MIGRRRRYAVPFVIAGLVAAGAAIPSAGAAPRLPRVTATRLVADVLGSRVQTFSGHVQWSADLSLPATSALTTSGGQAVPAAGGFDPMSLLSGTHQFSIWVDGATRQRIAAPSDLAETDLIHNGSNLWLWNSSNQQVTHYVVGRGAAAAAPDPESAVNPQTAAVALLRALAKSGTAVTVAGTAKVAGVDTYLLRLSPVGAARASSTVAGIVIAIDAANGFPLRVSVDAVGQSTPALQLGFTSISFHRPAASNFQEPHGRSTTTKVLGADSALQAQAGAGPVRVVGPRHLGPRRMVKAVAGAALPRVRAVAPSGRSGAERVRSIGSGWTTIGVFTIDPPSLAPVLRVATPVSGAWGSGRLVTSSLVNALVLPGGQVLAGLVTPAALEAAAASAG